MLQTKLYYISLVCNAGWTGDENEKKQENLKVCVDSNVLSKESAKLLVTEEEIENDKNKSSLHERFRNSFEKHFGSRQVHFIEKSKNCNQLALVRELQREKNTSSEKARCWRNEFKQFIFFFHAIHWLNLHDD